MNPVKKDFFDRKVEERREHGLGVSYGRINQEWNKSEERVKDMFKDVRSAKETAFESNFMDAEDVGGI